MSDKLAMLQSYQALAQSLASRDSLAALTSSRGGIACSVHPASMTVGSFVNPQLGAAVLFGKEDLDFALPGALPVIWQRQYNSHISPEHGSACGLLGHGWHLPIEISLELRKDRVLVFDAAGRVITFFQPSLAPGGQQRSPSEDLWLLRGGKDARGYPPAWSRQQRFAHVSAELASDENSIFVSSGTTDVLWVFAPAPVTQDTASGTSDEASHKDHDAHGSDGHQHDHAQGAGQSDTSTPGQRWRLVSQMDRFGRSQRYQYSQGGESGKRYFLDDDADDILPEGRLIAITDGIGRQFRCYHQRIHAGKPVQDAWGADDGWRLIGVRLEHDPYYFTTDPVFLVCYGYDWQGQLITVHDRAGELAREFEWHNRRISGHCHRGGPWHHYSYEDEGDEPDVKVTEHASEQGLSYRFEYQNLPPSLDNKPANATIITDNLEREESYCFAGLAGLNRVTEHHRADGTVIRYRHDNSGHRLSSTDPLDRKTAIRYDMLGNIIGIQDPGKSNRSLSYDQAGRLTASYDPTGAAIRYQYDDWGRRTQITQADGGVEHHHYPDPQEQPLTCDRPIRIEDAKGGIHHLQYNDAGQLISYTDSSGNTTLRDYDRWGDVIEEADPLGNTTRYERDPAGRISATHLPNGQIRHYRYDHQGNLVCIEPDENTSDCTLQIGRDRWGRITKTNLGSLTLQMHWDEAGRLITLTNENGARSRFVWDAMNRLVQETGFDGRVQRYQWDTAGQLIQVVQVIDDDKAIDDDSVAQEQTQTGQISTYRWDEAGRLIERQLPATETNDGQSQRYEWDTAGRLKTACVYLIKQEQEQTEERLQSRVEIERDALGHITGEIQRLYKMEEDASTSSAPAPEYEHCIAHQFDPAGNQQESELQNTGSIQWSFDDSGQLHRLAYDGQNLIDFERNALYREIRRQWHILQSAESTENPILAPLTQISHWDNLGQLQDTTLDTLPSQTARLAAPQTLIDQITHRQYRYDALGQLITLQTPAQTLHYSYDATGRLRAQADSLTPETATTQRWDVDPAGNRLPGQSPTQQQQQDWAELIHRRWRDPSFNLAQNLEPARENNSENNPIDKWQDNRIGFYQGCAWRYDAQGNRVEQIRQDDNGAYGRQRLTYDEANQLTALHIENIDAQGNVTALSESRYIYDALGRRLKKIVKEQEQECVIYYGWEGDRLVHTERMKEDGTRDIVHTVYEPHSFTPLIRLSTTAKGPQQVKQHLVVQAIKAAVPADQRDKLGIDPSLTMMQNILTEIPERMQKKLEEILQQVLQADLTAKGKATPGIVNKINRTNELISGMSKKMEERIQQLTPQQSQAIRGQMPGMARQTSDVIADMREGLKIMKQEEQGPITIHYYLCNHLSTPLALIDQQGNIVWATKLDPWGNIEEEFNPQDIDQPIRLAGQFHDLETGLYYNRCRYYDPKIGAYITQNPIGMGGGANGYHYAFNPITSTNPLGLLNLPALSGSVTSDMPGFSDMASFYTRFIENLSCIDSIGGIDAVRRLPVSSAPPQSPACQRKVGG